MAVSLNRGDPHIDPEILQRGPYYGDAQKGIGKPPSESGLEPSQQVLAGFGGPTVGKNCQKQVRHTPGNSEKP